MGNPISEVEDYLWSLVERADAPLKTFVDTLGLSGTWPEQLKRYKAKDRQVTDSESDDVSLRLYLGECVATPIIPSGREWVGMSFVLVGKLAVSGRTLEQFYEYALAVMNTIERYRLITPCPIAVISTETLAVLPPEEDDREFTFRLTLACKIEERVNLSS